MLLLASTIFATTALAACNKPLPQDSVDGTLCGYENLSSGPLQPGFTKCFSIASGGRDRYYSVHVPDDYTGGSAKDMVLSFHGRGGSSTSSETESHFSDQNLIAVYPNSMEGSWQGDPDIPSGTVDTDFVHDLLAHLEDTFCVNNVFASGKSNGGGFSITQLACDSRFTNRISAFAGVAAAVYDTYTECHPGDRIVPILEFHGTGDDVIDYDGGPRRGWNNIPVLDTVHNWAVRDKVDKIADHGVEVKFKGSTHLYYPSKSGQDPTTCLVQHYRIPGFCHCWPETSNDAGFSATSIIMDFFNTFAKA